MGVACRRPGPRPRACVYAPSRVGAMIVEMAADDEEAVDDLSDSRNWSDDDDMPPLVHSCGTPAAPPGLQPPGLPAEGQRVGTLSLRRLPKATRDVLKAVCGKRDGALFPHGAEMQQLDVCHEVPMAAVQEALAAAFAPPLTVNAFPGGRAAPPLTLFEICARIGRSGHLAELRQLAERRLSRLVQHESGLSCYSRPFASHHVPLFRRVLLHQALFRRPTTVLGSSTASEPSASASVAAPRDSGPRPSGHAAPRAAAHPRGGGPHGAALRCLPVAGHRRGGPVHAAQQAGEDPGSPQRT